MGKERTVKKRILLGLLLLLTAVACGGDEMRVMGVWARPSPPSAANGAFYMIIENRTGVDDALIGVQADVCGMAELHQSFMKDDGVMGMRPVPNNEVPIPAGEIVALQAGGIHVMCMNKTAAFQTGDEIPLRLTFATWGEMEAMAEIREN